MGYATDCVKWIVFTFNFLCVILGVTVLAVGSSLTASFDETDQLSTMISGLGISFIILGVITFVIAFFGCCGSVKENRCMVITYAAFLVMVLIITVSFGVWAFALGNTVRKDAPGASFFNNKFERSFPNYWEVESARVYINKIQSDWECCGIKGPSDYNQSGNMTLPQSCCEKQEMWADFIPCTTDNAYKVGCTTAVIEIATGFVEMSASVAIGAAVVEFVGIVFTICFANSISKGHRRGYRV